MRILSRIVLLLVLSVASARADGPPSVILAADEDDPKLARLAAEAARANEVHPAPRLKLSYRYLKMPHLDRSDIAFHGAQIDLYPVSIPWMRLGVNAALASGRGMLEGKPSSPWFFIGGVDLGLQYPYRITPFVDFRFAAGLLGGQIDQTAALTWTYHLGVEGGAEFYLFSRVFVSAAIGWLHTTYRGANLVELRKHPMNDVVYEAIVGDTFTVKVGIGL